MTLQRVKTVDRSGTRGDDRLLLDYEGRFLRRKRVTSAAGRAFIVDLPETISLETGDCFVLEDGTRVIVEAAPEALLRVRAENLPRIAWHVGNRHTPCQITGDHILIREDHVLAKMLTGLGAKVEPVTAPFEPEGGAYGHGRTLPHDNGHDHGSGHDHHH
ncbi:MAG: urease accessory protein UreE [Pseudomonadota bacterium]